MGDGSRHRAGQSRAARVVVALATACSVLAACSSEEPASSDAGASRSAESVEPTRAPSREPGTGSTDPQSAESKPADSQSADPQSAEESDAEELPSVPARGAVALAGQLNRASAVLRRADAPADEVRRAAELHQLAIRVLAARSDRFRRRVDDRLSRRAAGPVRSDVRAARLLQALGGPRPQPKFPPWRIIEPPPPSTLLQHYRGAQRRTGVPWSYLAAIHLVETRMGRIRGPSTAGALGPMQFLPTTWDLYGAGGDINDPRDAIYAAARLLKRHGAPRRMAKALWHYNQSASYVRAVTVYARAMRRSSAAYRGYWHWRVLYRQARGTFVLPTGYPKVRPVRLPG